MRRTVLKWVHWLAFFCILYFFFVEPKEGAAGKSAALNTHSGVGMILALVVLVWTIMYLRAGLTSRPGPKLPSWAKRVHKPLHILLHIVAPLMVATGAIAGMMAPFMVRAFGTLTIGFGNGSEQVHDLAIQAHEFVFNTLLALIIVHAVFNLWRHFIVKDNVLRTMMPKVLHRWL